MEVKTSRKKMLEELTRRSILESAASIVEKNGLKKFTMDRVAEEAGIAKGTLYLYFKNKEELLCHLTYQCFEPLDEKLDAIFNSIMSPLEKLEQYVTTSLLDAEENSSLYYELRFYLFELTEKDYLEDENDSGYKQGVLMISETIQEGVKKGLLRQVESDRVAILFLDSIYRLMVRRIFSAAKKSKFALSAEDDAKILMDLYIKGMQATEN